MAELKAHNGAGPWWDPLNISAPTNWANIRAPAVMWAGWYDIFLQGNLHGHYIYQHLSDPMVRGRNYLVVDPLGHCQDGAKYFPDQVGLIEGRTILPALLSLQMVAGNGTISDPAEGVKAVTFYVMGPDPSNPSVGPSPRGNHWSTLDSWPVWSGQRLYLGRAGTATLAAQGAPSPVAPAANASYVYDPKDPVKTVGGNNLIEACGPSDQRPVESRPDVLLHTSAALEADLYLTGPLRATLFVSSSAVDTDFTAKLSDVYPDGTSRLIQDGVLRMRWRLGGDTFWPVAPTPVVPGQIYRVEVDCWNTSYVFNKGHRLRVAVSSSNSPRFKANPNLGIDISEEDAHEPIIATNTLFYGGEHASYFELPVVQKAQLPKMILLIDPERKGSGHGPMVRPELIHAARNLTQFVASRAT